MVAGDRRSREPQMSGAELPRLAKMLDEGVEQDGAVSGALIGEPEEAGLAPSRAPAILDFEGAERSARAFDGIVETAEEDLVAAEQGFPALVRDRHEPRLGHVCGLEGIVHIKSRDETVTRGEARFHVLNICDRVVSAAAIEQRFLRLGATRRVLKSVRVVRIVGFQAHTELV